MEKIFNKIDELNEKYLNILEDVCNIESPTDYKKGVDDACRYIIDIAEKRGWKVEILPQKVSGDAVCITMNENAEGKPFAISGHMDTVHPVGCFGNPATTRDAEKMYGPGVTDCKGGVVAECAAASRYCPVTIWAGKARIDRNFLHATAEQSPEICSIAVVWSIVTPDVHSAKIVTFLDNLQQFCIFVC